MKIMAVFLFFFSSYFECTFFKMIRSAQAFSFFKYLFLPVQHYSLLFQQFLKKTQNILFIRMKERKIILGVEGTDKNVIVLSPPLCFTTDNARYIVQHFSEVLANIETEAAR